MNAIEQEETLAGKRKRLSNEETFLRVMKLNIENDASSVGSRLEALRVRAEEMQMQADALQERHDAVKSRLEEISDELDLIAEAGN